MREPRINDHIIRFGDGLRASRPYPFQIANDPLNVNPDMFQRVAPCPDDQTLEQGTDHETDDYTPKFGVPHGHDNE